MIKAACAVTAECAGQSCNCCVLTRSFSQGGMNTSFELDASGCAGHPAGVSKKTCLIFFVGLGGILTSGPGIIQCGRGGALRMVLAIFIGTYASRASLALGNFKAVVAKNATMARATSIDSGCAGLAAWAASETSKTVSHELFPTSKATRGS